MFSLKKHGFGHLFCKFVYGRFPLPCSLTKLRLLRQKMPFEAFFILELLRYHLQPCIRKVFFILKIQLGGTRPRGSEVLPCFHLKKHGFGHLFCKFAYGRFPLPCSLTKLRLLRQKMPFEAFFILELLRYHLQPCIRKVFLSLKFN